MVLLAHFNKGMPLYKYTTVETWLAYLLLATPMLFDVSYDMNVYLGTVTTLFNIQASTVAQTAKVGHPFVRDAWSLSMSVPVRNRYVEKRLTAIH